MTFRKNVKRETELLKQWRIGETIKRTSLLTNTPEGTVSHYYRRFNKNRDKYIKLFETGDREPPKTSPIEAASASIIYGDVLKKVTEFFQKEDYTKARDYLQTIMLLQDFDKRVSLILQNVDPKKMDEVMRIIISLVKLTSSAPTSGSDKKEAQAKDTQEQMSENKSPR